jgi:very-short-patch-repair endonuclease
MDERHPHPNPLPQAGEGARQESSDSLSRSRERAGVRARELRVNQTDAESVLWYRLRSRQLSGLKFRRQHPITTFIADFACLEIGLVVELDGGQHVEQFTYDNNREEQMKRAGFQTLRFWNHEVLNETDAVMEKIRQVAETLTLTPTLSR